MQTRPSIRRLLGPGLLLPLVLLAGCGTGDGPTPIPGTPAPPPPPVTCDNINFEDGCGPFTFVDFAGGVASIVRNPEAAGLNTSDKVAQMQKFAGEPFGGSLLQLPELINFSRGQAFKMKVWSRRAVPVLFKLEGPDSNSQADDKERTLNHSGSSDWEELCFDFTGDTAGLTSRAITFIFDNGVNGAAATDPNNWTFFFDEIEQVADCGIPVVALPVDFEGDPANYNFGPDGGFGGGASAVIANPDQSGLNTSAQVARMQKFAGEVFGGSTLGLSSAVDFSQGEAIKMKVWASREVPVLFKFEGPDPNSQADDKERTLNHSGSGGWEELCFDFTGDTAGLTSRAITLIFDLGVNGNANSDPDNWTFFFDDIEQAASCGGGPVPLGPVDFEPDGFGQGFTWNVFENGDNPPLTFLANPDPTGANTSATVAQFTARVAGQPFAGTGTSNLPTFTLDSTNSCVKIKVWKTVVSDVGIKFERADQASSGEIKVPNTVTNAWEELTFDFAGKIGEPSSTDITGFVLFPDFAARTQENVVYFDDILFLDGAACSGGGGTPTRVDFEGDPAQFDFGPGGGFGGGVSTVIGNPVPGGINTSGQVVQMEKFADQVFGGSTLALPGGVDWSQGETFTMKVWSRRSVPVRFKLENNIQERDDTHDGGSQWQELCFDFTGTIGGAALTGISIFFDLGVVGDAANDPDNWTFYYDDIQQKSGGCAPPPPSFATITFDDPGTTYTLTDFGGNLSTVTNDPAGGTNQVAQVVKPVGAELWAGTTVSTLPGDAVPRIPLTASSTKMSVRVFSPDAGIPILLKIEDASDGGIFVETTATTTQVNTWETLTFDFANQTSGTPAFNEANTYNKISIFFNFGTTGAVAGEKTYYFDDVAVGPGPGGGGIIPEAVVFATDPSVPRDLAPPAIDNFGSGAVFDDAFAGDADYNPAFLVTSGTGFGGQHVGFVAFNGYAAGFAAAFGTFEFKVKVNAPGSASNFEVKFINGGDTSRTYDLTTYSGSTPLGNGWYQVQIPMSDFAATIAANSGFLLGPLGGQAGAFTMLLTDIGFSGTAGGGPTGELAVNGGFEAGDLSGWEVFPNSGTITVIDTDSSSGTFSVRVVAGQGQNPVLKQERRAAGTVNPGDTINISFDMKGTAADGGVIFPELISEPAGPGQLLDTIAAPTAGWTTYSYSPTAGANVSEGITFQLAVVCGGAPTCSANALIDNVSITIAP